MQRGNPSDKMISNVELWENLLSWLATFDGGIGAAGNVKLVETEYGRGLVARSDIAPDTPLVFVPTEALVNTSTLAPLYPPHFITSLTSTRWLSLHLSLQYRRHYDRSIPVESKPIDLFWPFLVSLPMTFPTVPLTWSIGRRTLDEIRQDFEVSELDHSLVDAKYNREVGKRAIFTDLLNCLSPSVLLRAQDVEKRLKSDWLVTKQVWDSEAIESEATGTSLNFLDFVWGWLNVNTRCVYFDIGGKTSNNITLAPVIDMINHRDGVWVKPLQRQHSLSFSSPPLTCPDPPIKANDELGFTYGAHEDPMLLAEYGFTLGGTNFYNNVSVDLELESLFENLGEEGKIKRGVLEDEGYWGGMTLQANPEPASASWRVLMALRLLHLSLESSSTSNESYADKLAPWYLVMTGEEEVLSEENEQKVKGSIRIICETAARLLEEGGKRCDDLAARWSTLNVNDELKVSLKMVRGIWEGELMIVEEVLNNL